MWTRSGSQRFDTLFDDVEAISGKATMYIADAIRPGDDQLVNLRCSSQPEVKPQIVLRGVASSGSDLADLYGPTSPQLNSGTQGHGNQVE